MTAIKDLLKACDEFIPEPTRDEDKDFLMCIEDTFIIEGRGLVATGRVERGVIKKMEEILATLQASQSLQLSCQQVTDMTREYLKVISLIPTIKSLSTTT